MPQIEELPEGVNVVGADVSDDDAMEMLAAVLGGQQPHLSKVESRGIHDAECQQYDEDDDDDEDESLAERLLGLTEMFPERLSHFVGGVIGASAKSSKWLLSAGRVAVWVVVSSATILALPVMFEHERGQMEEQQLLQQRQMLLGPNTAVAAGHMAHPLVPH